MACYYFHSEHRFAVAAVGEGGRLKSVGPPGGRRRGEIQFIWEDVEDGKIIRLCM